jgi:predicted ATPase
VPDREHRPVSLSGLPSGGLVGRAVESAAIQRTLGRARLVTITGPPGVGKTAVGIAAAVRLSRGFAGGAWLVRLDSLRDGSLLPNTIANVLKLPGGRTGSRADALVDALCDRRLLLVLDTCEHLTGACAELAMRLLLMPDRGTRILATSRQSLRVPGGLTVRVGPLPVRDAVTLFGRRAAEAAPQFRITPENRAMVAAICRRLDQLPLATELAARQLAVGPLERLHSRLEEDYWFLRNSGNVPPRHKTLRAAIGWSYQLCRPAEQLLWARLSVFTGSFTVGDAEDVCSDKNLPKEVIDAAVTMLAARSLLRIEPRSGGRTRFRLLATVRAYGAAMLPRGDDEWERRHQAWQAVHHDHQREITEDDQGTLTRGQRA